MGMTHNVLIEFEELCAADQQAVLKSLGVSLPPQSPAVFARTVAKHIVANKLADAFFAAIDALWESR